MFGSVGASGDLAPLAHVALSLLGEGRAEVDGQERRMQEALAGAGLGAGQAATQGRARAH